MKAIQAAAGLVTALAAPALTATCLTATCLFATLSVAQPVTAAPTPPLASGIDRANGDPSVRPQDDLYRHVNGEWLRKTVIPADKTSVGNDEEIDDATQDELRKIIEAAPGSADPEVLKLGDFFASFMDEETVDKRGVTPLAGELAAIDAARSPKDIAVLMVRLRRIGVGMPISIDVVQDERDSTRYVPTLRQGGLGLPDRDYFLDLKDPKFSVVREKYVEHLATLLTLADANAPDPKATAQAVLALQTEIARAQWTKVENRDPIKGYNRYEVAALPTLAPGVDWNAFVSAAHLDGRTKDVIVRQPSFLKALGELLRTAPLSTWKAYARTRLLEAYARYLDKSFVDARFAFAGGVLSGATENRPRWKRGVELVDGSIGEGVGKRYVESYFPPSSKARMEQLVANLLAAYRESIATIDWMSPATKTEALAKLAKFNVKVGYPKRWIDYRALVVKRDDLVGNVMRANAFEDDRAIAKLGKPIDRDEWGMTPQTVNAYYDPSMNEIVFPAAFLQGQNFNAAADDAVNYGAIGAVIGHEISHGFDDEGSQFDGNGNLRDWWTAEDRERFAAKTQALVAQYSAFVAVPPDYHVNGELTLGENIADNSGLAIAYKAYRISLGGKPAPVIDGMSGDERFFYGFAQAWRGKTRDQALLSQIKSDPHSPDEFRVTGAVRNHPAFYSTFGVKPGDRMYLPPEARVSIW